MKPPVHYQVFYIVHGSFSEAYYFDAEYHICDVFSQDFIDKLKAIHEEHHSGNEFRLRDYNFKPILNRSHWGAAGFGHKAFETGYAVINQPAHFNPPFYEVIQRY